MAQSRAPTAVLAWAAGALVAIPLVIDPFGRNPFGPLRWLLAVTVVGTGVSYGLVSGQLRWPHSVFICWSLFLTATVAAAVLGTDPLLALVGDADRLYGVVSIAAAFGAFLIGCSLGPIQRHLVMRVLIVTGGVIALYGVVQAFQLDFLRVPAGIDTERVRSTLGNAGFLGAYLCLLIPPAVALMADRREVVAWRRLSAVVTVLALAAVVMTRTRGAWIGVVVGLAAWVALSGLRLRRGVIVVGVFLILVLAVITPLGTRALSATNFSSGTGAGRLDTWVVSLRAVGESPALGYGQEGLRRAFEHVVDARWVQRYGLEHIPDRAHNSFLDVTASSGLIGLVAFTALLVALSHAARKEAARRDPIAIGLAAALLAYVVQAQFLFDTFDLSIVFWVTAGILVRAEAATTTRHIRSVLLPVVVATAAAVVWGGLGIVADHRAGRPSGPLTAQSGRLISAAELRPRALAYNLQAAARAITSADAGVLQRAHGLLTRWDDPDVKLADADVLARLGAVTGDRQSVVQAIAVYRDVLRQQPHNGLAWLGMGEATVKLNDLPSARAAFGQAAVLLPRSAYPRLDLALLDLAVGDRSSAEQELRRARRADRHNPAIADLERRLRSQ